jgi:MbtH protein
MTDSGETEDIRAWQVVVNDEEQYSVWPFGREVPAGWQATGASGTKEECLQHIGEIWMDITPRSVRERLAT